MLVLGVGIGLLLFVDYYRRRYRARRLQGGLAGGIVYMFQIAGGSIGLGLNTTIFTSRSSSNLESHLHPSAPR